MEASQEAQVRNHKDLSKVMERRWGRSARKNRRGRTSRRWEVRREHSFQYQLTNNRVRVGRRRKDDVFILLSPVTFWNRSSRGSQLEEALLTRGWARVCLRKGAAGGRWMGRPWHR